MKIGIDIRLIGKKQTGSEVFIFNLVKNLAKIESEHEFCLFTDNCDDEQKQQIAKDLGIIDKKNFKIISLETPNRFAWNFWTLPNYLRKNTVDVYHTQYITPFFVPKSIKIVTIVHDISFNFFPQFIRLADLFFLKTLIPLSLKRADMIVGVSQFTRDEIIRYYKVSPEKIEYIYNSVGDEFLDEKPSAEQLERVREKYKLPEKFILYMGTLQPRKNLPQLIEAFARITDKIDETKLVICGNRSGHNFDKRIDGAILKNKLEDEVVFPGFVDETDKVAIFALAHVFVFPSLYEGFGIPVLEAMSQKVPVLASDIPSLKEIAESGALYFDLSNIDDFSEKLYNISVDDNLRSGLIRAGENRISFFSWEKSAREMLAIFEKMRHNR